MTHDPSPPPAVAKKLTVYEPQALLGGFARTLRTAAQELRASRYLIWKLFVRDFHVQFRQKIFGYFWTIIAPFFAVFGFVLLHAAGILSPGDTGVPYPLYVFVGLTTWGTLASTITAVSNGLVAQGELILKTSVPKIALAVAALAQVLYTIVVQLATIAVLMLLSGVAPNPASVLFIPALLPMLLLGLSVGLVTSVVGSIARDLASMIQTALSLLMFLTPVIFVASTVANPWIRMLIWLNPLTYLVEVPRALLLHGETAFWPQYLLVSAASLVVLALAVRGFYLVQDLVAERL
ncbi:MAG: ABC transporter permease [Acetobacteraceae bacterium]|nr:ABC transporter permease [Acetobacteraceae bacterium]